jgi:hypothetical protein
MTENWPKRTEKEKGKQHNLLHAGEQWTKEEEGEKDCK